AAERVVLVEHSSERRLRHERKLRGPDRRGRRGARLIVERAVLAEAPPRPQTIEADAARTPDSADAALREEDLDLALEPDVDAIAWRAFGQDHLSRRRVDRLRHVENELEIPRSEPLEHDRAGERCAVRTEVHGGYRFFAVRDGVRPAMLSGVSFRPWPGYGC